MSTDDSDDTHRRCQLCPQMVPEGELPNHLYEVHGDEPEAVEREYGGGEFQAVFDELEARGWPPERTETDRGEAIGGKWYVLGVGGCGNNLLDAIHLRRDRPGLGGVSAGGRSPTRVWEAALEGSEMLNADSKDLSNTYSARELGRTSPGGFAETRTISPEVSSEGAGANPEVALEWIQSDLDDGSGEIPFQTLYSDDFNRADIQNAQAILLLHSTVRGTGTGATPHLAERLADDSVDDRKEESVFAATVLPKNSDYSERTQSQIIRNGLIGPARMATAADAIMPFDNWKLRPPIGPDRIDWPPPRKCDGARYRPQNEAFVQFIELFSMSSLPAEANAELGISGDNFDVTDAHERARQVQSDSSIDGELATILAPAMRRYHRGVQPGEFDEETLQNLLLDTCLSGRLAEFDPATAWGGTFLFVAPKEIRDDVADVVDRAGDQPFIHPGVLDGRDDGPMTEVEKCVIGSDVVDGLYLWATFWNPTLETYQEMYDIARDSLRRDEMLEQEWGKIEQFRELQGRDALRSDQWGQL